MTPRDSEIHGAIVISLALLACGILLWTRWPETATATRVLFWGGSSALVLLLALFPNPLRPLNRFVPSLFRLPWIWLALAIVIAATPLLGTTEQYGGKRLIGGDLGIRSGLWVVLCHMVFLAILSQRPQLSIKALTLSLLGTGALALLLLLQPDLFAILALSITCLVTGLRARNRMQFWLPVASAGGYLVLIAAVLTSNYRWKRIVWHFDAYKKDPFGRGFESRILTQAFEQSGWQGYHDLANSVMNHLPKSLEWYSFAYFSLWLGKAALFAAIGILIALAVVFFRYASQAQHPLQHTLLLSATTLYCLNLLWASAGVYAPILPNTHFGVPFLDPGQFSLVTALLLLFSTMSTSHGGAS